jgi:hypothetical protein
LSEREKGAKAGSPMSPPRPTCLSPQGAFAKRVAEKVFESLKFRLRLPVFLSSRGRVYPPFRIPPLRQLVSVIQPV